MPRRADRFAIFLRPEHPAEFASVLAALATSVHGSISVDLAEDLGMTLQGLDASNIAMVRMRAPIGAFKEYSIAAPAHLDVSCEDLKRVLRGYSGDLILYQETGKPDVLNIEKVDAKSKWTLRLTQKSFEHFEIPPTPARATIAYAEGKRLAGALSELKSALADDADAVTFSASRATPGEWSAVCGGAAASRRFAQRLVGESGVAPADSLSLTVSGRHLLSFLQVASVAKGPAALRVIGFPDGDMFCVLAESAARDFEVEMFIAPRA